MYSIKLGNIRNMSLCLKYLQMFVYYQIKNTMASLMRFSFIIMQTSKETCWHSAQPHSNYNFANISFIMQMRTQIIFYELTDKFLDSDICLVIQGTYQFLYT